MLRALKVLVVVVNLIIVIILATSLYVVATGRLQLLLPAGEEIQYRIAAQDILFESNVSVINGGLYDISGVGIDIEVLTEQGEQLVDYRHPRFTIPAGRVHVEPVSVPMNLSVLQEANSLIFSDSLLTIAIEVEAHYTMGLIRFHSAYESTKLWTALVPERQILYENAQVDVEGDTANVTIPYIVTTSPLLSGAANVSVELRNASGVLSAADVTIPLGERHLGFAYLEMTNETYQALRAETQLLQFAFVVELSGGARFEEVLPIPWSPP